ncbi:class I SAM-dependent methyltransferase [Romboutsia maritimum]|nr:class I SAM-dependent methyltransferase [Romboutsia maritimum]
MSELKMNQDFLSTIRDYWDDSSERYSKINNNELNYKYNIWNQIILKYAQSKKKLRILDIGTGPGILAIIMAKSGHNVTAIDISEGMIEKARINAKMYGVDINFKLMDAHNLIFEDGYFDLLISRNVIWNLQYPEIAFKEFRRVLNNKGRIIYFDSNWYLHLFNQQQKEKLKNAREELLKRYGEITLKEEHEYKLEEIACNLPLSKEHRPKWDEEILNKYEFCPMYVDEDIYNIVWDEHEKVKYRYAPLFMIVAKVKYNNCIY